MTKFAQGTEVSVEKSRAEIEKLIVRYGATHTIFAMEPKRAIIAFEARERRIRFDLPLPDREDRAYTEMKVNSTSTKPRTPEAAYAAWESACRQKWRALCLVIKAKLEAVESGITTFEAEFYANIILPDGRTIHEATKDRVAQAYATNKSIPLLEGPRS